MRGKTCVWLFWAFTTVMSAAYGAMSLYVFIELTKLKKRGFKSEEGVANKWGVYAATLLSFACVAFYVVFTLLVLLRKSFHAKAATGYGIVLASAGQTAMILLLSALVLHGANDRTKYWKNKKWFSENAFMAYQGAFALGYILAFFYALNCLILLFFKPALDYETPPAPPPTSQSIALSEPQPDIEKPLAEPVKSVDDVSTHAVEEVHDQVVQKKGFLGAWKK